MAKSNPPKEYTVFIKYFAELVDTLKTQHVLCYLIRDRIVNVDDSQRIEAAVTMKDKAKKLLDLLAGPLQAGYSNGLRSLLEAMEQHGVEAEKKIAMTIKSDLGCIEADSGPLVAQGKEFTLFMVIFKRRKIEDPLNYCMK